MKEGRGNGFRVEGKMKKIQEEEVGKWHRVPVGLAVSLSLCQRG